MYLSPPVEEARVNILNDLYSWESIVITLPRITHARYQVGELDDKNLNRSLYFLESDVWTFALWAIFLLKFYIFHANHIIAISKQFIQFILSTFHISNNLMPFKVLNCHVQKY